jgi:hypothetical protein
MTPSVPTTAYERIAIAPNTPEDRRALSGKFVVATQVFAIRRVTARARSSDNLTNQGGSV